MFLLPTTVNVEAAAREVDGCQMVRREWALLDSLPSPGRQADATLHLLDSLLVDAA
jgi:hypothetical protein